MWGSGKVSFGSWKVQNNLQNDLIFIRTIFCFKLPKFSIVYTNISPVSYTHLDVYKRQPLYHAKTKKSVIFLETKNVSNVVSYMRFFIKGGKNPMMCALLLSCVGLSRHWFFSAILLLYRLSSCKAMFSFT